MNEFGLENKRRAPLQNLGKHPNECIFTFGPDDVYEERKIWLGKLRCEEKTQMLMLLLLMLQKRSEERSKATSHGQEKNNPTYKIHTCSSATTANENVLR